MLSLALLASATMLCAQKSTTKYQFTQAREPQVWVEPAIKPLVAEVELVPNCRTSFTLGPEVLTNEFVEVALHGEVENVRNYGTFPSRDVTASGDDHNAAWPEVTLGENEREGQRAEKYTFTAEHQKKNKPAETYRLAESDWLNLNVGDPIYITEKRTGAKPYISDEKGTKIADLVREK